MSVNCRQPNVILNSELTAKIYFLIFSHGFRHWRSCDYNTTAPQM